MRARHPDTNYVWVYPPLATPFSLSLLNHLDDSVQFSHTAATVMTLCQIQLFTKFRDMTTLSSLLHKVYSFFIGIPKKPRKKKSIYNNTHQTERSVPKTKKWAYNCTFIYLLKPNQRIEKPVVKTAYTQRLKPKIKICRTLLPKLHQIRKTF